jgi:hypothetical protein
MANVAVHSTLLLGNGTIVDLQTTLAEGAFGELKTSTDFAVAATSLGTFADGQIISQVLVPPTAPNGVAGVAYINRRGAIVALLPTTVDGQVAHQGGPLGFRLAAGDTLQVMPLAATSRVFTYAVKTAQGTCAVFQGTPAGAASTSLSHILTGQSLGESLQGQTIVMHLATSIDGSKLSNGSVLHLNDRALPIGSCAAVNPSNQQVTFMSASTPVGLNHIAQVITNA